MAQPADPIAYAIVRAWFPPEREGTLIVRITTDVEHVADSSKTEVATTIEGALVVVRSWLETFVASHERVASTRVIEEDAGRITAAVKRG